MASDVAQGSGTSRAIVVLVHALRKEGKQMLFLCRSLCVIAGIIIAAVGDLWRLGASFSSTNSRQLWPRRVVSLLSQLVGWRALRPLGSAHGEELAAACPPS